MPPLVTRRFDILLIEDKPADVAVTIAAFRDALVDAQVHVAEDGEEAMVLLQGDKAIVSLHVRVASFVVVSEAFFQPLCWECGVLGLVECSFESCRLVVRFLKALSSLADAFAAFSAGLMS